MLYDLITEFNSFLKTTESVGEFSNWLSRNALIQDWDRRDVYQACLNRLPELRKLHSWKYTTPVECAQHIEGCLLSAEFRSRIVEILNAANPSLLRTFFVHIPRTRGTSLLQSIEDDGVLYWHDSFNHDEWLCKYCNRTGIDPTLFLIKLLSSTLSSDNSLFVAGHVPLADLISRKLIKAKDRVFTVVRPPKDIILSAVNYILSVASSTSSEPDARDWREWITSLGCDNLIYGTFDDDSLRRLLRSQRFAEEYRNPLTRYLSDDGTVDGALHCISLTNCDVVLEEDVSSYLLRTLGIHTPMGHHNGSNLSICEHTSMLRDDPIMNDLCAEDEKLYIELQRHCYQSSL